MKEITYVFILGMWAGFFIGLTIAGLYFTFGGK